MFSDREKNVDILRLITRGFVVSVIVGAIGTVFFYFVAYTGQHIPDADVASQWQNCKWSAIFTVACLPGALLFSICLRIKSRALDRYSATHCPNCGFDLGPIIENQRIRIFSEREAGESLRASIYFDTYCPVCHTQRTIRE